MSSELLSVFDIARRLNLHVKTVRNYVREGRLKAVRIGKQYRITRADLEAFTGHPLPLTESEAAKRHRHVESSSVVQIDAIGPDLVTRLEQSLAALAHGTSKEQGGLKIDTIYDRHLGRLKVIVIGGLDDTAAALKLINALVEK